MKKKILVLTGSPRKNGNSARLADAFIKGAQSAGHEVMRFDAGRVDVHPCKACGACWSRGIPCTFSDGFDEFASVLESADALVFATPLYWFGFPAQLKAAIDKMNAYLKQSCPRPLKIHESLLMVCAADDVPGLFDAVIANYRQIAAYMKWQDKGILTVPGVSEKGDIDAAGMLIKAEEFGKSF